MRVHVAGGGPAGLTAAYELAKAGHAPFVAEAGDRDGGIARTEIYKGFRFDMGGHRFFTKIEEVDALWRELLVDDFIKRPRLSRIFFRNRFIDYPLRPLNVLASLGPVETTRILASYAVTRLKPHAREDTFAEWVTNRFGQRLFDMFFKSYTEKVWGISTDELSADWAAQRIKNLSITEAIRAALSPSSNSHTSLIEEFDYPLLGPGQMWETTARLIEEHGGTVAMSSRVGRIYHDGGIVKSIDIAKGGETTTHDTDALISTMALPELIFNLDPPPPADVLAAAGRLRHRAFLTVCLIIDEPDLFADNWIYVHDPQVQVARIQNFKNWSPDMVPDASQTSLGLEYFCDEGDETWARDHADLVAQATREVEAIGLCPAAKVRDGCVFRVPGAYPVYNATYRDDVERIRRHLETFANLQTVGRNGLHRYNNQDHAMLSGMCAVRNLIGGETHDVWSINTEPDYHEQAKSDDDSLTRSRNPAGDAGRRSRFFR